jgi:hypothetical protein
MAPLLEFVGGQRAPFILAGRELVIGRGGDCGLRIDGDGTSDRHARLTVDASGKVYIQDLDTQTGTLRNGNYVYGVQELEEGDRIDIGGTGLMFRARANVPAPAAVAMAAPVTAARPVADSAPAAAAAAPPASRRAGADDRTRMPMELPAEVRAVLAAREAQKDQPTPPPPVQAAPAGVIVGTPEPEPDNFRTVQMQAPDLAALGIDPASLPPALQPAKRTMIGMGVVSPQLANAPTGLPTPPAITQQPLAPKAAPIVEQPTMLAAGLTPEQQAAITRAQQQAMAAQQAMMAQQQAMQQPMQQQAMDAHPAMPQQPPPKTAPMAAVVPEPVPYEETAKTNPLPHAKAQTYTPPAHKGAFGSFSRAFAFMGQMLSLASQHKALLKPLVWDAIITTPIMALFAVLGAVIHFHAAWQVYSFMGLACFTLYFVDYCCNAITASLMYDFATTGEASMQTARPRVMKALPGILTFAGVSALLDILSTYARERNDIVAKIVLRVLRAIWTTATYVIMPALVIEGVSFGAAFKRSKVLMEQDPTGVGAGVVALSIVSYVVAAICFPLAWFTMRAVGHLSAPVGLLAGMLIVNAYWAISGWMKISYSTCFYMWARECERVGHADSSLAPLPLRHALDAA